jgi:hypothetical protein
MRRIVVHIDRLVLSGMSRADAPILGESLRGELARALTEPALTHRLGSGADIPHVHAGTIRVGPGAPPRATGTSAARAIAKRFAR